MTPEAQIDIDLTALKAIAANSTVRLQAEFRKHPFALRRQREEA